MPKYPAQIDNSQSLPTAIDNLTPVQGSIFNKLRDAVLAVESELGVKPSGSYTTVRSRLDTLEGIVGNLLIIELHKDLGGTLEEPLVIGLQGRPVSTVPPAFGQVLAWNGIAWIPSTGSGGGGGFDPPAASSAGQTLVWDGSAYIPNFILGDDVTPPYDQTLTSTITLVEVNQTVSSPAFTATYEIPPTTSSITDDEFDTPTDVSSSPESFISPFDYTKSAYGDIVTFTLTALQGYVTKTVDYQIEWAQKVYYGVATAGQTGETFIKSLAGQPITNTKNVAFAINAGTGQKIYYACRSIYGDMVFTIHDTEGGFTKTQSNVDITNDFGFTEEYDLYESDYASLGALNIFVGDGDDFFQSGGGPIGPIGPTGPEGPAIIIFDGGDPAENMRSTRATAQSPINDGYAGQNNFSSAEDIGDGQSPANLVTSGTSGNFSAILSGNFNEVKSGYATITGGMGNRIINPSNGATFSFINGGKDNTINESSSTPLNSILGGANHAISDTSSSAIIGGSDHIIRQDSIYSAIIGGLINIIEDCGHSAIVAGNINTLTNSNYSIVLSGHENLITGSNYSSIIGGDQHGISSSNNSAILGGFNHQITNSPGFSTIIGGQEGLIQDATQATIIGGFNNQINNGVNSVILGGFGNILNDANYSAIIAGNTNTIEADAAATIGDSNRVEDSANNSLAIGSYTQTIRFGQVAHSSVGAKFGSSAGLSQYSIYSVANQSTDDTVIQLTDAVGSELILEDGKSYTIKATCTANRVDDSNRFSSVDYILAHQTAGVAVIDNITSIYTADDGVPWTITYTVNGADEILSANFLGAETHTVNVMVTYEISEVSQ